MEVLIGALARHGHALAQAVDDHHCRILVSEDLFEVAPGGDAYVSWERNVQPFSLGDPFSYIHVARVRPGDLHPVVGGRDRPRVVTLGQRNSSPHGGVKSLGLVGISGYNREFGQDFPRIAVNRRTQRVEIVWNDASLHPMGDIWLRAMPMDLPKAATGGELPKIMTTLFDQLKPEAAYFAPRDGHRAAYIVFDMQDSSQIVEIAEPLFQSLGAKVSFAPVMNMDDLRKGLTTAGLG